MEVAQRQGQGVLSDRKLLVVALGLGWQHAIEGLQPIPQGMWDLVLPLGLFERAVCAIGGGGAGGHLWSETADFLSAAAGQILPLPQSFVMHRASRSSERAEPCEPGIPTAPQDGDFYEGLGVVLQTFVQP